MEYNDAPTAIDLFEGGGGDRPVKAPPDLSRRKIEKNTFIKGGWGPRVEL